jgi:hypothetical protein
MRRVVGLGLLMMCLAAPHAVAAPAGHGSCPTIKDAEGDTGSVNDTALDVRAVVIAVTPQQITATLRVSGQPDPSAVGAARRYDVSFAIPEEGTFILRAAVGNGGAYYELIDNKVHATSPDGSYAESWTHVRPLTGSVGRNSVTIVAARPADLPLHGGAEVYGQAWLTVSDARPVEAAGLRVDEWDGVAAGVDRSPAAKMIFGSRKVCTSRK